MPQRRVAHQTPLTVTVGLRDGSKKLGHLRLFDPEADFLELSIPSQSFDGDLKPTQLSLAISHIAFVGFHRHGSGKSSTEDLDEHTEFEVHLPGKVDFTVMADAIDILDPVGYYAVPVGEKSAFGEIFFFASAVSSVEDKAPLGELLIKNNLLTLEELESALSQQEATQNAPIGQILVEQRKVDPKSLAGAVEKQKALLRRGRPTLRLGEVLVEAGLATDDDIQAALTEQKKRRGRRLGEVLIDMGIVTEVDVAKVLAQKFNLPYADLDTTPINPEAFLEIPLGLIRKYQVFPYWSDGSTLKVAMSDPLAMETLDMLRFSISKEIVEVMATPSQIEARLEPYLAVDVDDGSVGEMDEILKELTLENEKGEEQSEHEDSLTVAHAEDSAVAKLVNRILVDAIKRNVSDIHVEPNGGETPITIRYRSDGICAVYRKLPPVLRSQLVTRIKIMANLDIAEKRKPQDGKIRFLYGDRRVELRVATLPVVTKDEDVVMRILAGSGTMPLDKMGFSERNLRESRALAARPYGLILVVGPTGSGKTTTLHAMLGDINTPERKIWTAEDPVEITQPGLRQVQVHPKIGFTFASAMRAFLRADPDVIMVGEMRDHETASTGIEASLTGHMVFSTLHTNSAPETVTRLIDMGLDPFSFSDALLGILAQRLARRVCSECRVIEEATALEREELVKYYGAEELEATLQGAAPKLARAVGCPKCQDTGYKGRIGIHELLVNDDAIREAIQSKATAAEIRDLARAGGMKTLLQDGIEKCLSGETDLKQVLAVCSR